MPFETQPPTATDPLSVYCAETGLSVDEVRLGTLKRVDCELGNLLDNNLNALHPEDRAGLEDLRRQVRLALGGA